MESETASWRPTFTPIANSYGLDPFLVEALIQAESRGRADAFRYEPLFWQRYLSRKDEYKTLNPRRVSSSYGLMQIMYVVAKELGYIGEPEGLFLPRTNLHWGCRKLKQLMDWAQGFPVSPEVARRAALASYNGGKGGNAPTGILRPESRQYADRLLAVRQGLMDQLGGGTHV